MVTDQASIVVSRPLSGIFDVRRIAVRLDGEVVARLYKGRSAHIKVEPGLHTVRASVDWTRSPHLSLDLADADEAAIEVSAPLSELWRTWIVPRSSLVCKQIECP